MLYIYFFLVFLTLAYLLCFSFYSLYIGPSRVNVKIHVFSRNYLMHKHVYLTMYTRISNGSFDIIFHLLRRYIWFSISFYFLYRFNVSIKNTFFFNAFSTFSKLHKYWLHWLSSYHIVVIIIVTFLFFRLLQITINDKNLTRFFKCTHNSIELLVQHFLFIFNFCLFFR